MINLALIVYLFIKFRKDISKFNKSLNEIEFNEKLQSMLSEDIKSENLHKLAGNLFTKIKLKYNLKANSFSEAIEELKRRYDIPQDFRDLVIDFFNHMVIISYKKETISTDELVELKKKIRFIIQSLKN
ncbi:MAG: hypothetical protein PWP03_750 [Candidatus Woesearchaeota archaeon]|nr:hypothetical protein [Candidatus Woesearchaeota archaeon]MDN5328112.1 hypothetical protein [Candidatus Woesearchaeota archaeon]